MPSPLDVINRAGPQGRRNLAAAVQVYAPGRALPPGFTGGARVLPTAVGSPAAQAEQQRLAHAPYQAPTLGATDWDSVADQYINSPEAMKQRQDAANKQAKDDAESKLSWWQRGIADVVSNPVVHAAMRGLSVLSVPGKAVTLGLQKLHEALPDSVNHFMHEVPAFGLMGMMDDDKIAANEKDSTWYQKLAPGSDYGASQVYSDAPIPGVTGFRNIVADVATDPLSYVTVGSHEVATQAERMAKVAELAEKSPQIVKDLAPELRQGIRRGFGVMSEEARAAVEAPELGLRFAGQRIPGTGKIGEALAQIGAGRRALTEKVADRLPEIVREARVPENLSDAYRIMRNTSSTPEEVLRAAAQVSMENARRVGEGSMSARGNELLRKATKDIWKGKSAAEREATTAAGEAAGTTPLNDLIQSIAKVHSDVTGRALDPAYMRDPETYVPHMLDSKFRRYLKEQTNAAASDFKKLSGITSDDLLETSGYLDKARALTAGKVVEIGGKKIEIGDDTIRGLNETLHDAFPGYTGRIYLDDPAKITEAYVSSLSRDAGARRAVERFADAQHAARLGGDASALGGRMTGELNDVREAMNESMRQQPQAARILPTMEEGYKPGEIPSIPDAPRIVGGKAEDAARDLHARLPELMEQFKDDPAAQAQLQHLADETPKPFSENIVPSDFFKAVEHNKASEELVARANQTQPFLGDMADDIAARKKVVKTSLGEQVAEQVAGTKVAAKQIGRDIKAVDARIAEHAQSLSELKQLTTDKAPKIEQLLGDLKGEQADLERQIKSRSAVYKGKLTKAENDVDRRLYKQARQLKSLREQAEAKVDELPARIAEEIRARTDALNEPVARAQDILDQVRAKGAPDNIVKRAEQQLEQAKQMRATRQEAIVRTPGGQRIWNDTKGFEPGGQRVVEPVKDVPQPDALFDYPPGGNNFKKVPVPPQRREVDAIGDLRRLMGDETSEPARAARSEATKAVENEQMFNEARPVVAEHFKETARTEIGAARDAELGPMQQRHDVVQNLASDLNDKQQLVAKRQANEQLATKLNKVKGNLKNPDLRQSVNDLVEITKNNPKLDDVSATATASLLQSHADELQKVEKVQDFGKAVAKMGSDARSGKLPKIMAATLHDRWVMMHSGLVQEGDAFVDRELYKMFTRIHEIGKEPGLFGRTFNALTNLFKTYATLSPGFHVRNAMSGIFMNSADGVGLARQLEAVGLWRDFRKGGEEWLAEQEPRVQRAFEATFGSGAGGRFIAEEAAGKSESSLYNKLSNNKLTRQSIKAGEWVEGPLRLGMALDSVDKGQTVSSALERISRVHFDYSQISKLDAKAKRLVPFWTFMSRNLPLQLQEVYTNPALYSAYQHFKQDTTVPNAPFTPSYWNNLGSWNTGAHLGGLPLYVQPDFGFTRIGNDLNDLADLVTLRNPGAALSNINPLITAPAGFLTHRDFFRDKTFGPNDYTKKGGPLGSLETALATIFGQTNEKGQVSDNFDHLFTTLNPVADRVQRLVPESVGSGGDPDRRAESWLRYFGAPIRTLSPAQQRGEMYRRYLEAQAEQKRVRAMNREDARAG